MLETITLQTAIKGCIPIAKNLFQKLIQPILSTKLSKYLEKKRELKSFEINSVKYLSWAAGYCSTINTIAFPNTPKKLEDLYLPLTITDENRENIVVNDRADIFQTSSKILVIDTAGMGKSTLAKKVLLNIIAEGNCIPVFIELRQLKNKNISEQIFKKLGVSPSIPVTFINELPLAFIFDGLDEISYQHKPQIIQEIREFIDKLDNPKILITSRQESYLSELYDFKRYRIEPLSKENAYSLINRYDPERETAKKLIMGIKKSRDRGIHEFLSTPLFVSLLFCAYRYKTIIPQKRHLFYSQVYEALFEAHDLSKEIGFVRPKHSKLDSAEFHTILRRLGFWCLKNGGKVELQNDELEIVLTEIISKTAGIQASSVEFIKDLTNTVPLFIKEGSSLRWSHKSLMEYFSAMFITKDTKDKQSEVLLHFYKSNDWSGYINVFELCADIDFSAMRTSIIKEVLNKFINHYTNSYKKITNKKIKIKDIEYRKGLTFCNTLGFRLLNKKHLSDNFDIFWEDDNPDIVYIKESCDTEAKEESRFIIDLMRGEKFLIGFKISSRESMIVSILRYKCPNLFIESSESNKELIKRIVDSNIKEDKLFVTTDDPKNPINSQKNFSIINDLLRIHVGKSLSYDEAIKELRCIDENSTNGIDELIGDLY
ncbi:MAG: NACHT domain-containing protein [Gammaproteobacteria bacterium]|nr:NACHT domain-containing protein [Gammaproteobacteria bacterium]